MNEPVVTHEILKAARLFVDRNLGRPSLAQPWAFCASRMNIVFASDGHTMFIARDLAGKDFPKKPVQIGEPYTGPMPGWGQIVTNLPAIRRAFAPVALNPKYHARVMKAAACLGIQVISMSAGGAAREIVYTLGPDAFAIVMPMLDPEKPVVPEWVRKVCKS